MSNAHVLVVDDEADIRALIKDILTDEGYGVTDAANANEARAARAERRFDLILLDIWMPDTDGITLLREWSDRRRSELPGCDHVGSWHGRYGRRGHAAGCVRLCRETTVAAEAAANRRVGARVGRQADESGTQAAAVAARAGRPQRADAGAARARAAVCAS